MLSADTATADGNLVTVTVYETLLAAMGTCERWGAVMPTHPGSQLQPSMYRAS